MDTIWLEDLRALADTLNFSRAAQRRNVTQPAFGRRIKAFEDWCGSPLVDRSTHRLELTPAGTRMLAAADEVLSALERARTELEQARTAGSVLTFASTHALSFTYFPAWFRTLGPTAASVPVRLLSDNMIACEKLMAEGRADFLLCHHHAQAPIDLSDSAFRHITLARDALVPLTRRGDDGTPLHVLPGTEQAPAPVLGYDGQSGMGRILRIALEGREALHQREVFTSHLAVVLKALAQEGKGVAWVPRSLAETELANGDLCLAGDAEWAVEVAIVLLRPRAALSPLAERFWHDVERRAD